VGGVGQTIPGDTMERMTLKWKCIFFAAEFTRTLDTMRWKGGEGAAGDGVGQSLKTSSLLTMMTKKGCQYLGKKGDTNPSDVMTYYQ